MKRLALPFRVAMLVLVGTLLGFGLSAGRPVQAEKHIEPVVEQDTAAGPVVPWRQARLLAEVLKRVREDYVEEVSDEQLIDAAIRGIVAQLDAYSAFLEPQQFDEMRISTSGEYSGVGLQVTIEDGVVKVVESMEDTPAERAGVRAGDAIIAVDDIPVDTDNLDDTIDRMRGQPGSEVKLTIARQESVEPLEFTLARASVQVHSVRHRLLPDGVGYVRISNFSETTAADVAAALAALQTSRGAALSALILDLRNNPGGLLEAAVEVSDQFLDEGVIVSADGRAADARFQMEAQAGDALHGAPLLVLVNSGSASAAEIVAGALQDHGRALLIGQQTYGKGSVQTVMPLLDGKALKLTTSKYFTPSGASIHKTGIMPDIAIEADEAIRQTGKPPRFNVDVEQDPELRAALSVLKDGRDLRQTRAQ